MRSLPDQEARSQAVSPHLSAIVRAPAGAGKTSLLVARMLHLLPVVEHPEDLVCTTFTVKAANEMRQRVSSALIDAAKQHRSNTSEPEYQAACEAIRHEHVRKWALDRNTQRLRVMTLDSLSGSICNIVGSNPIVTGRPVASDLAGLALAGARRFMNEAPTFLSTDAAGASAILEALAAPFHGNLSKLTDWLMQRILARAAWAIDFAEMQDGSAGDSTVAYFRSIDKRLTYGRDQAAESLGIEIAEVEGAIQAAGSVAQLMGWIATKAYRLRKVCAKKAPPAVRVLFDLLIRGHEIDPASVDGMLALMTVRLPTTTEVTAAVAAPAIVAWNQVWRGLLAAMDWEMLDRGEVDHSARTIAALSAVGGTGFPEDKGLEVGERIRHLLVDEFQDCSRAQYRTLLALTEGWVPGDGRTFFAVGDEMQLVYAWRGAEETVFDDARREFKARLGARDLTLICNFRTHDRLVQDVGELCRVPRSSFDRALGPQTFDTNNWAHLNEPLLSKGQGQECKDYQTIPVIRFKEGYGNIAAARVGAARYALQELKASIAQNRTAAILYRTKNSVEPLLRVAMERGIDLRLGVGGGKIAASIAIQSLHALHRVCVDEMDGVAMACLLRLPVFGWSAQEFAVCADHADGDLLRGLASQGHRDYQVIEHAMSAFTQHSGARDAALRAAWQVVEREVASPVSSQPGLATDKVSFEAYFDAARVCPSEWMGDRLDVLLDKGYFLPPSDAGTPCIEAMTIHAAKGLEWDDVIVWEESEKSVSLEDLEVPFRRERSLREFLPSQAGEDNTMREYQKLVTKARLLSEAIRLLYVACTRARERLWVLAVPKSKNGPQVLAHIVERMEEHQPSGDDAAEMSQRPSAGPRKWQRATPIELTGLPPQRTDKPKRIDLDFGPRSRGTVIHEWLSKMTETTLLALPDRADLLTAAHARLRTVGCAEDDRDAMARDVVDTVVHIKSDPVLKWILSVHSEGLDEREYELTSSDGTVHRIDRVFIDDGVCWIIDYKSDLPVDGANIEGFEDTLKRDHTAQLQRYGDAMTAVLPDVVSVQCAIYSTAVGKLLHVEFDA